MARELHPAALEKRIYNIEMEWPSIEGERLSGDKTFEELGIASGEDLAQTNEDLLEVTQIVNGMKMNVKTPLLFEDTTNYELVESDSAFCNYIVRNGICVVNLSLIVNSATNANTYVMSGLPTPASGFAFGTLSAHTVGVSDNVQININSAGRIGLRHGSNNAQYLGSVAYIVQEE